MIVNEDDPLKAQVVNDRISSLLTQANLLLSEKISGVAGRLRADPGRAAGTFKIPFLNQTVHILGLQKAEQILNSASKAPAAGQARAAWRR